MEKVDKDGFKTSRVILKLAAFMLEKHSDYLSDNWCNDPDIEVINMINEIGNDEFQAMADEMNNGECEDAMYYDWIIASTISNELNKMAESSNHNPNSN